MEEPSVLDYLKSKLIPWKYPSLEIPEEEDPTKGIIQEVPLRQLPEAIEDPGTAGSSRVNWRGFLALLLALVAQHSMGPGPDRTWIPGVILLLVSVICLLWANLHGEWGLAPIPESASIIDPPVFNLTNFLIGLILAIAAFLSLGGLRFTYLNLILLLLALAFIVKAFWIPSGQSHISIPRILQRLSHPIWTVNLSPPSLLALAAIACVIFFRFYQFDQVPPEMNSDHAEKILDISRVLEGDTNIFFPNNGGREALQMYLVAALHIIFKSDLNFTALKLATTLIGFLSLPFIYLLGKEVGNQRIGILAFIFMGIAYWPNVVSRVGLRLPFYILFTASTLYFLLRGIRNSNRNDFILAGISLGVSLYGYSADRILPLLVIVGMCLFLIHPQALKKRKFVIVSVIALVLVSFILFIPLLRYIIAEPNTFLFRTLTRMSSLERPLPGSVWQIFFRNLWNALTMFSWSNGEVWPISIPHYPALGVVPGALFYLGATLLLKRYIFQRNWLDLFLLVSIPLLMLPSILALAFPAENPNLYRTGGAMVPIFLMIGMAMDGFMTSTCSFLSLPWGRRIAWSMAILLLGLASYQDYDLVFNKYFQQYQRSAWNTSEMGKVVKDFIEITGHPDNAWVMGYPHWVDTRLVAINAGFPQEDYQIFVEELEGTLAEPGAKLFLVNPEDEAALDSLLLQYPKGWTQRYKSKVETKDFIIFLTPPSSDD